VTSEKMDRSFEKSVYQTIVMAYRPFLFWILLSLFLGFLGRVLVLGNANLIGYWIDHMQEFSFQQLATALLITSILGFFCTILFRVLFSRLSAKAVSSIYDEVTIRTSRYPMRFFDTTPAGRIITRFSSDYGNVFRLFGGPLAEFLAIIFDLVAMIILITVASPVYLPAVALIAALNFFVYKRNISRLREARRNLSSSRSPSIAHFAETAQGASTIRTFNKEQKFFERFKKFDQIYLSEKLNASRQLLKYSFKLNSLTAILLLTTGLIAIFLIEHNWLTIGSLGVAFAFITLSGSTVQMFFEWMGQFEEAMVGMERLDRYLRLPLEKGAHLPAQSLFKTEHAKFSFESEQKTQEQVMTVAPHARVSFENVWFRYSDELPFVLKDISFDVKAGERLGVIGRTGSGKSSLIQALFHFYPISEGKVRVAGKSAIDEVDLELFRRSLSYISQDSILFSGSLRENLDIENRYSDDWICHILKQVGLLDWATPSALEQKIFEKGKNLSLGEKQLICVARCLLQNAPVVILDEATSSVDPQSEEILIQTTEKFFKNRTQIIIAHRLSTLESCDRILWLDDGKIKMIGPPQEILHSFKEQ
jgi:ABC-type multidrug transport system fused ATPase/permease subunit